MRRSFHASLYDGFFAPKKSEIKEEKKDFKKDLFFFKKEVYEFMGYIILNRRFDLNLKFNKSLTRRSNLPSWTIAFTTTFVGIKDL